MQLGSAGVCLEAHCGLEQLFLGSPFRWAQGSELREKLLGDLLVQLCWGARCSVSDSPYPHRTCSQGTVPPSLSAVPWSAVTHSGWTGIVPDVNRTLHLWQGL